MKFISGIKDIANDYSHFIFDVWGIVHDGQKPYTGAAEAIAFLRSQGKKICFLSNAPRRATKVAKVLEGYGITPDLYDFILTSGEAAFLDLQKNQQNNFQTFGKNYLYIGPQKDLDLLDGLDYVRVENAAEANLVINTGFDDENSTLAEKLPQALAALKYNLPMICVNPDFIVVKQSGIEMLCAGTLAREYEKLGGKVFYYGKPYLAVYKMVCEIFNNFQNRDYIAIGDALETDIKGANDFGVDAILATCGILANSLQIKQGEEADPVRLQTLCKNQNTFPKFVISSLKI